MVNETVAGFPYAPDALMAMLMPALIVLIVWFIVFLAFYIYHSLALMKIAKRTSTERSILAWIPIANFYLMSRIAKAPGWSFLAYLASIGAVIYSFYQMFAVPGSSPADSLFFAALLSVIVGSALFVWYLWGMCVSRNFPGWLSLLTLVPYVGSLWYFVLLGILAWGGEGMFDQTARM